LDVNMARPKVLSDTEVLSAAHRLIHERGPEALTFAALSAACGLSSATLVQRFRSKPDLVRSTLLHAWDALEARTAEAAAAAPKTADGAIQLLVTLSRAYGGIEAYANGLLVLREDIRDPVLRARGTRWKRSLVSALDQCIAATGANPGTGLLIASHWQGCLLWWSFEPEGSIEAYVETSLRSLMTALLGSERAWA
jgi:AcrR family transcriptional regulator